VGCVGNCEFIFPPGFFRDTGMVGLRKGDGRAGLIRCSASASSASCRHRSLCLIRTERLWL
jgi:hypothetical protein